MTMMTTLTLKAATMSLQDDPHTQVDRQPQPLTAKALPYPPQRVAYLAPPAAAAAESQQLLLAPAQLIPWLQATEA
jgi:hypothetical protein